jgi:hypothetical protein
MSLNGLAKKVVPVVEQFERSGRSSEKPPPQQPMIEVQPPNQIQNYYPTKGS